MTDSHLVAIVSQHLSGSQGAAVPSAGAECTKGTSRRKVFPVSTPCAGGDGFPRPSANIVLPSKERRHGPSRPRPRRRSVQLTNCWSLPGSGSLRSPSPCAVKAQHRPNAPDHLQGQASATLRRLYGLEIQSLASAKRKAPRSTTTPAQPPSL